MPLSCDYDNYDDFKWNYEIPDDFSILNYRTKCISCEKKLFKKDMCIEFKIHPYDEHQTPLPSKFHCERCGEIFLNLDSIGYSIYIEENMENLLKEYQDYVGFKVGKNGK